MALKWLVDKDEKGQWYFTKGKVAPALVTEVAKTNLPYLKWLLDNDAGTIPLEGRNYIANIVKRTETKQA